MSTAEYISSGGAVGGGLNWLADESGNVEVDELGQPIESGPFTEITVTTYRESTGGAVAGGSSEITVATYRESTGGAVVGGSSEITVATCRESTGGAVAGGSSEITVTTYRESTGGAVAGGSSEIAVTNPHTDLFFTCYTVQAVRRQLIADNYFLTVRRRY